MIVSVTLNRILMLTLALNLILIKTKPHLNNSLSLSLSLGHCTDVQQFPASIDVMLFYEERARLGLELGLVYAIFASEF
jgi:hypothetical protein